MWPLFCLTTSCKRTLAFVTTFQHKSSESARHNFTMWALSCATFSGHFTNWWHLSHFPWTIAFTHMFATSILWCYNFNGMIKWYDISCSTLYYWNHWMSQFSGLHSCFILKGHGVQFSIFSLEMSCPAEDFQNFPVPARKLSTWLWKIPVPNRCFKKKQVNVYLLFLSSHHLLSRSYP